MALFPRAAAKYALAGIFASIVAAQVTAGVAWLVVSTDWAPTSLFYMVLFGGLITTCVRLSRRYGTNAIGKDFGVSWRPSDLGWGILVSFGAAFATGFVTSALTAAGPLHHAALSYRDDLRSMGGGTLAGWALTAVLVAPIVEEMVFRGLLLRSLASAVGPGRAVPLQAIAFGCYHLSLGLGLYNVVYFASTATFGLIMGVIATRRDRLGITISAHALTNIVSFVAIAAIR